MATPEQIQPNPTFTSHGDSLELAGPWRLIQVQHLDLSVIKPVNGRAVVLDGGRLSTIDTGSAALLLLALKTRKVTLQNFSEDAQQIFNLALKMPSETAPLKERRLSIFAQIGRGIVEGLGSLGILLKYIGETFVLQLRTFIRPSLWRPKELFVQLEQCAMNAVPVVALVMLLIGIVVAYLFASQIEKYGANIFIVDGVTISICRELSPLIVAIIVAGRSGSAFTAQLGTMKLNEEVDALETMGLSPMRVLVLPRVLALIIAVPILVAVGDVVGIFGGQLVAYYRLGIEFPTFIDRMQDVLKIRHVYLGLLKAPVYAAFIAIIGCKMGLTVENNARSIGLNTTSTVVQSIVSVILLNAGFAVLFVNLGI